MSNYQANIITKNPATPTGPVQTGSAPGMWRMDEVSYWLKQGVWPTQGVTGADPYFPYVTLLLSTTALGNANNNLFVDSSGAFNPISRSGNTTQGSATPYSANWSNYFGSSDYLQISGPATGTGTWTVEGWFYFTSLPGGTIFAQGTADTASCWFLYLTSSGGLNFYSNGNISASSSGVVAANTWVHIALVSNSSNSTTYVNGTSVATGSYAGKTFTGGPFQLNRGYGGATNGNPCYQSNVRMVVGTAVYTSNFTPPTSALTAISGTSLLTCQSNRFRDASTNNYTVASTGSVTVTDFSPFSPSAAITYNQSDITNWSNYFDGNGDYLTVPSSSAFNYGTGDFTIECWGYRGSSANFWCGYSASGVSFTLFSYSGASSTIQVYSNGFYDSGINPGYNTWFHVAVTRSSGTLRIFINGVQGFSGSYTTDISSHAVRIGSSTANEWGLGNVSNLRVVKGTALYTSNFTPPTTNLTAVSGTSLLTCQSAAFTDNSTNNFVITPTGEVTVTGNSPFNTVGYWSNYFDGSGDYFTTPSNTALYFGTGDFTIEGWFYRSNSGTTEIPLSFGNAIGAYIFTFRPSSTTWGAYGSGDFVTGAVTPTNTWVHIAISRSGTTTRMFIGGVLSASGTDTTDYTLGPCYVGRVYDGSYDYKGYISNLRIVKGTAVYTSAFTPPTSPLTAITNTSLLTCQNGRFIDNSTNAFTLTVAGNTSAQSFDPFYTSTIASNGGSMYFDGSGDYLDGPALAGFGGSGNFTVQAWIYPTNVSGRDFCIYETRGGSGWVWFINSTGYLQVYDSSSGIQTASNTQLKVGQWTHVALVKNGSTCTYYVNAVSAGTFTLATFQPATRVRVGARNDTAEAFVGWICGLKTDNSALTISLPTAPQTPSANTTLLVNGMNAGIYDATAINDMETVGNAQVSTVQSKFGGSSVYFDGTGDYLTSNAASDLYAFGTGDFTVEMWFNLSSFANLQVLYDSRPTSTDGLYVCIFVPAGGASVNLQVSAATQITGTATLSTGVWYHLALSRSSGSTKMFLNGTQVGSTYADTNAYLNSGTTRPFIGGSSYSAGTLTVNGYIDEVRVTKGVARYTSNFTPPTQAFPTF